jgi:dihydrofolate reductase
MRKLTLWMQSSFDGRISGPGGEFDWPIVDKPLTDTFGRIAERFDTLLYGRKVYEMMAGFWPTADQNPAADDYTRFYSRHWRETPKVVFSRTLEDAGWDTTVVAEDLPGAVAELKKQPGKGLACFGGAEVNHQLIKAGLVDDYQIFVHPVVLGGGPTLFPESGADRTKLTLTESQTFDSGVVALHYTT